MQVWRRIGAVVALALAGLGARAGGAAAESRALAAAVIDNMPLVGIEGGQAIGVIGDALRHMAKQLDWRLEMKADIPPARIYDSLHRGGIDIVASVLPTPERSSQAWYLANIVDEYSALYVRRGAGVVIRNPDDLRGLRVAGRLGFKYPVLDDHADIRLVRFNTTSAMIMAVAHGAIDAFIGGSVGTEGVLASLEQDGKLERLPVAIAAIPHTIALSHRAFSQRQAQAASRVLDAWLAGPAFAVSLARHGGPARFAKMPTWQEQGPPVPLP